jgi:hypothetical protein
VITRFGVAPRRRGLTTGEFQAHWHGRHGELAAKINGVQRYWQNHAVLRDGEPLVAWPGFDACADIDFPDVATMNAGFAAEQYRQHVRDDEKVLVEKEKGGLIITRRILREGTIDLAGIRLLTFLRCAPGRTPSALGDALASVPQASASTARELFVALGADDTGLGAGIFDAVDIHWFDQPSTAERYLTSSEARERQHQVADMVRGVERLIARVRVIV